MSCEEIQKRMSEWALNNFRTVPDDARQHVESCAACRAEQATWQTLIRELETVAAIEPDKKLMERTVARAVVMLNQQARTRLARRVWWASLAALPFEIGLLWVGMFAVHYIATQLFANVWAERVTHVAFGMGLFSLAAAYLVAVPMLARSLRGAREKSRARSGLQSFRMI